MDKRPHADNAGESGQDAPDYNWLYGTQRKGVGSTSEPTSDPEPTRVLPRAQPAGRTPESDRRRAAGPPPSTPPKRRLLEGWRRVRWGWLKYLLVLWLVFLIAVPLWAWTKIDKVDAEPSGTRPGAQPGTTYLLVGSDSRKGLTAKQRRRLATGQAAGQRTDTIMLLHTGRGPNLLMSIPRDSLVDVPGHGTTKINAAYSYGGPKLLVETIESATGIRVDDYVEIGFAGFVKLVNSVGGIEICPKSAMRDPLANLDIKAGCQDVKGRTALGYARSRHTSGLGDIDRARHQREVVSAVGNKAASPWTVLNPVRYFRLASSGADSLTIGQNTGPIATVKFAWGMTRVNGKSGLTCGVPIADLAVHWDTDRAKRLFSLIRSDRTKDVTKRLCGASGLKNP